jgi:hypothetical protein
MKALLAKLPCRQALGLYVGEGEIALSRVAMTLAGPVEIARTTLPCPPDSQGEMIQTLLGPLGNRKRRPPLGLGIPAQQVFFSTRPIRTSDDAATPQVLLHEVLQSPTVAIDDMVVDLIRAQPENRKVASIVACRKKYFHKLLGDVIKQPVRVALAEPTPCALLRLAASQHPAPRRSRTVIRIFLGRDKGLAAGVCGHLPLIWRTFSLPESDASAAIQTQVRALEALVTYCGVETAPSAIMVHGRPDLRDQLKSETFIQKVAARLHWTDGPGLEPAMIAHGLALGAANPDHDGFDMARFLKPPLSFKEMFPWKELVAQVAIVMGLALFFHLKTEDLDDKYHSAHMEIQQRPALQDIADKDLNKEKKDLKQQVEAVQKFLSTRINWTSYTKEICDHLPQAASLNRFHAMCEFSSDSSKPGQKSLMVRAAVPVSAGGKMPHEVDDFLGDMRASPLLQRDYPLVDLAELHWTQPPERGAKPIFTFTIMALPKPKEKKKEGSPGSGSAGSGSAASSAAPK